LLAPAHLCLELVFQLLLFIPDLLYLQQDARSMANLKYPSGKKETTANIDSLPQCVDGNTPSLGAKCFRLLKGCLQADSSCEVMGFLMGFLVT